MRWMAGHFWWWAQAGVWDCEQCREIQHVVWLDDDTMEYAQFDRSAMTGNEQVVGDLPMRVTKVRKIVAVEPLCFLINPKEDQEHTGEQEVLAMFRRQRERELT